MNGFLIKFLGGKTVKNVQIQIHKHVAANLELMCEKSVREREREKEREGGQGELNRQDRETGT